MIPPEQCVPAHSNSPGGSGQGAQPRSGAELKPTAQAMGTWWGSGQAPKGRKKERLIQIRITLYLHRLFRRRTIAIANDEILGDDVLIGMV